MTDLTNQQQIENLEEILLSYAFTIREKEIVIAMNTDKVTVKDYVLALSDGLRYGNWPWTTNSTPKSFRGDE